MSSREKSEANQIMKKEKEEEDDVVCLDASFFMNDNYELTTFTFGSLELQLLCLQSASSCVLLNNYLSQNPHVVQGCSVIELGSGVGVTGILCSRFCREVLLTDHNDEVVKIMKKNIELNTSTGSHDCCAGLASEKLEWGNADQISQILQKYPTGFDLVLGADICFQQSSIPPLFNTVEKLLQLRGKDNCKFILGYVSRAKTMDAMVIEEAVKHGMLVNEVIGTRSVVRNYEGVIYEITLK
ncbi:protein N-lysine methyltransferase METTL21A-like isoform X2 [Papaver somniferum]|uniref:protein N-lysine methyltransferase METTL21A-like isoform X2 n=1 Tax=Papaver somniferum TaxID=3469 RepID=UPI000E6FD814|nr:protein N-lysine methyltransferase METTL21A-like isoform X2 [Papaver somniferum]